MTVAFTPNALESALIERLPADAAVRSALAETGLPHRRVEDWKWSDLRAVSAKLPVEAGTLTLTATRPADVQAPVSETPQRLLPQLAAALVPAQSYTLSDGEVLSLDLHASAGVSHALIDLRVPKGVRARIEERYRAEPGALANIAVRLTVEEGAEAVRIIEQDASPDAVLVASSTLDLQRGARAAQTTLGFGARLARLETHVRHAGEGASLQLDGAYIVGAGLHLDQTSVVRHEGAHGATSELFKGAAAGGGKGVFQGKIYVAEGAQKTDAQMQHRGLLLDAKAEIDAKPELEIYADDVVCAHGNAFGAIDDEALFYMRQRGLPEAAARALLTESFLAEPLERVADEAVRDRLSERLRRALETVS